MIKKKPCCMSLMNFRAMSDLRIDYRDGCGIPGEVH